MFYFKKDQTKILIENFFKASSNFKKRPQLKFDNFTVKFYRSKNIFRVKLLKSDSQ